MDSKIRLDLRSLFSLIVCLLICLCDSLYDPVLHAESAALYGNINVYGGYFLDLLVGTPPQRVSLVLDMSSRISTFACTGCPRCREQADSEFNITMSSTASWVACGYTCAGLCNEGLCTYNQHLVSGSSFYGFWFKDSFRIADRSERNPEVNGSMGCQWKENRTSVIRAVTGIMGIGPPSSAQDVRHQTLLQEVFNDHSHIESKIFSICLAEWGGILLVGGQNTAYHTSSVQQLPLSLTNGYYSVHLSSIEVHGSLVTVQAGRAMINSGEAYTHLDSATYRALRETIESFCNAHGGCGAIGYGNCWQIVHGGEGLLRFPNITLVFELLRTIWPPKAYLYHNGTGAMWCYAFEDHGASSGILLGASWMLHHDVIFDLRSNQVGVAPAKCPEHRRLPVDNSHAKVERLPTNLTSAAGISAAPGSLQPSTTASRTSIGPPTTASFMSARTGTRLATTGSLAALSAVPRSFVATSTGFVPFQQTQAAPGNVVEVPILRQPSVSKTPANLGTIPTGVANSGSQWPYLNARFRTNLSKLLVACGCVLLLCVCASCLAKRLRYQLDHRHVRLKDSDDSGMPAQIVGSIQDGDAEVFVIGPDEEALSEEEGLNSVFNIETPMPPASPWLYDSALAGSNSDSSSITGVKSKVEPRPSSNTEASWVDELAKNASALE